MTHEGGAQLLGLDCLQVFSGIYYIRHVGILCMCVCISIDAHIHIYIYI